MRNLQLFALAFLLASCGAVGGQVVSIPVEEAKDIATLAGQAASFDYNYNGILDTTETALYLVWLSDQIYKRWSVPTPEETAAERAKAAGQPLPSETES